MTDSNCKTIGEECRQIIGESFRLIAHLVGSTALFISLALCAALIRVFTVWVATWVDDTVIITILTAVEYGMLGFDILLIAIALVQAVVRFAKGA